jgi:hypothetical protein
MNCAVCHPSRDQDFRQATVSLIAILVCLGAAADSGATNTI